MSTPIDGMCHRCLQPLPPKAGRCPNCGERRQGTIGTGPFLMGAAGILTLVFLVWMMVFVFKNQAITNSAPADDSSSTQQQAKPPALDK